VACSQCSREFCETGELAQYITANRQRAAQLRKVLAVVSVIKALEAGLQRAASPVGLLPGSGIAGRSGTRRCRRLVIPMDLLMPELCVVRPPLLVVAQHIKCLQTAVVAILLWEGWVRLKVSVLQAS